MTWLCKGRNSHFLTLILQPKSPPSTSENSIENALGSRDGSAISTSLTIYQQQREESWTRETDILTIWSSLNSNPDNMKLNRTDKVIKNATCKWCSPKMHIQNLKAYRQACVFTFYSDINISTLQWKQNIFSWDWTIDNLWNYRCTMHGIVSAMLR